MSGILHKLTHFIKELKHLSLSPSPENQFQHYSDQLAKSGLKKLLKQIIQDKDDDLAVTDAELIALQKSARQILHSGNFKKIANEIVAYCDSILLEREELLKFLLDLIWLCKMVNAIAVLDVSKIVKPLVPICKRAFGTEFHKTDEIISFFHHSDYISLFTALSKCAFFSQQIFQSLIANQSERLEQQTKELRSAKNAVRVPLSANLLDKLAALQEQNAMAPSSAPTSPAAKESLPVMRMRALSAPRMNMTDYSTSSTLAIEQDLVSSFNNLIIAPSSRSEDESDEKRRSRENKRFKKD